MLKAEGRETTDTVDLLKVSKGGNRWTAERIIECLCAWAETYGTYPTRDELRRTGLTCLESARQRSFKGLHEELRYAVESRTGMALTQSKRPNGFYDESTVSLMLRPLCEQNGRFPSRREIIASLGSTFCRAMTAVGGPRKIAEAMGYEYPGPKRLSKAEIKELFRGNCGKRITVAAIREALGARGVTLVYRHWQGMDDLRKSLATK